MHVILKKKNNSHLRVDSWDQNFEFQMDIVFEIHCMNSSQFYCHYLWLHTLNNHVIFFLYSFIILISVSKKILNLVLDTSLYITYVFEFSLYYQPINTSAADPVDREAGLCDMLIDSMHFSTFVSLIIFSTF